MVEVFPKATPVADLELFLRGERAWLNGYWESRTWRELGLMFDGIDFDPNHIPTTYRPMRYLLLVGPSGWKTRNLIAANALTQRRIEALGEARCRSARSIWRIRAQAHEDGVLGRGKFSVQPVR